MPKQPHRLRRKAPEQPKPPTPVADIFAAITALDDDEANLLWGVFDAAMHDEWDCSISTGFELFGVQELRVVTKTATVMAKHAEEEE
jgi:hypothetical protein